MTTRPRAGRASSRPLSLAFWLSLIAVLAAALPGCSKYDELVEKDQQAAMAWADVEAQLQRRYDLVPNLVNTVKAAAKHESATLTAVAEARSQAAQIKLTADDLSDPEKMAAFQKAQDNLKGTLSRLMVIQEQYPELKANENFRGLQVQLEGTENRILRAREVYNDAARQYNTALAKVGGMAINKVTGKPFKPRVFFSAAAGAESAPQVSFE